MRVLYFGTYDPNYVRNWVLINGLKRNGVEVLECRDKLSKLGLLKLAFGYLKIKKDFDVMVVGFPGQEVMFLARLLTLRLFSRQARKPIIFDAFTSHYGGYILDRQKFSKNSFHAYYYRFLDKWSCRLADMVLLDTNAHINFFIKEYNLSKEKFRRVWVGVPTEKIEIVGVKSEADRFRVVFLGTYIPLHGVEFIVKAAKILESYPDIIFTLIGNGQEKKKIEHLVKELGLKNIIFHGMLSIESLRQEMANSDVCLGIFGASPKTFLVIPNKIYEAVALGKPVITADTEAIRELFDENDMMLVPNANAEALAVAVIKLKNDTVLKDKLAASAHKKFLTLLTYPVIGKELVNIIKTYLLEP